MIAIEKTCYFFQLLEQEMTRSKGEVVWPLDRDVEVNRLLAAPSSREHRLRSDWSSEAKAEDQRLRCASMNSGFMNVEL